MEPLTGKEFCNPLFGWRIDSWICYLIWCAVISLAARVAQNFFKAWSLLHDDVLPAYELLSREKRGGLGFIWWNHLCGFQLGKNSDLFLPTMLGFIELLAYPVLIATGQVVIIGAWLGVKTAGQWGGWRKSPTAFNRFLLFSAFNILAAFYLSAHFVHHVPCSVEVSHTGTIRWFSP